MSEIENLLTEDLLQAATYLCLVAAATTDLDQISGPPRQRRMHASRRRFESAVKAIKAGKTLSELGLTSDDCAWAAEQAGRAKDPDSWMQAFRSAEQALKVEEKSAEAC